MKNKKIGLIAGVFFLNITFAAPRPLDHIVVIANNEVVLESQVNTMMQSIKMQAQQNHQPLPDDRLLRRQVIERLIMDALLLQLGQQANVQITDQQLDHVIQGIAKQNGLTPEQMMQHLAKAGVSIKNYREQIRRDVIISEVRSKEVGNRVNVTPQEVDNLVKRMDKQNKPGTELNLSHILLSLPENPTENQRASQLVLANKLIADLKQGANFSQLAAAHSSDPQALNGGNRGWEKVESLPTLFARALSSASKGDIIGPITTGVGIHILKVNDIRGESPQISATEFHAHHILIKVSPITSDEQAHKKIQKIYTDIKSNQLTFDDAAKQFSEDSASANRGGDLGWVMPELFAPPFRDALLKLKKGEISDPVQTTFGWHLIQLIDRRQVDKTDAAKKERAYQLLFDRKFNEESQIWLQQIRARAYVKMMNSLEK